MTPLYNGISNLGRGTMRMVDELGYFGALLVETFYFTFAGWRVGQPLRVKAVFEQIRQIGVDAVPIVALLAVTIGLSLAINGIAQLERFGAESAIVVGLGIGVTREFGPLITGIVIAGRTASALAARLGSMTVSQEVDALRVIGVSEPVRYLAAPPMIAALIMMPCLTIIADFFAILGGALFALSAVDMSLSGFLYQCLIVLEPWDINQGLIKSLVFGCLIVLIGVATGFSVTGGAEGVGRATTRAVVLSICAILVADMIFSFFLNR
jgi:phospholipid/cholesterol/gamma-HCH transport system permease protein